VICLCCVVVSDDSSQYICCLIMHDDVFHRAMIVVSLLVHLFLCNLVLFVLHHIICGVVSLHFFNKLQLLLYHLLLSQFFILCCN
jgi:hypothetical protein